MFIIMMLMTDWNVINMQKNVTNILFFVTNILKWPQSLRHQHNDVTNITVTQITARLETHCMKKLIKLYALHGIC